MSSSSSESANEMINTQGINGDIVRSGSNCINPEDDIEIIKDEPYREEERATVESTLKTVDETGTKFRFKGKKVFLTYPGHINKDEYTNWIRGRFSNHTLNVVIAHEGADSATNYNHSHVLLQSNKDMDVKNPRGFDYESDADDNPHPNIQKIAGKLHLQNIYKYLCKEDKSNLFLLEKAVVKKEISICEKIWECETIQDAYRLYGGKGKGKCSQMEIKGYWMDKPEPVLVQEPLVLRSWMAPYMSVLAHAVNNPNRRRINVLRGRVGGEGKSSLADEIARRYPKKWRYLEKPVKAGWHGCTKLLNMWSREGWDKTGLIVDCPRKCNKENMDTLMDILECLKNSRWSNDAFGGSSRQGNSMMCVVVMCNQFPRLTDMSLDRWELHDLISDPDNEGEYKVQRLHLRQPKAALVDDLKAKRLAKGQVAQTTFSHLEERPYEPIYEPGEFIETADYTL